MILCDLFSRKRSSLFFPCPSSPSCNLPFTDNYSSSSLASPSSFDRIAGGSFGLNGEQYQLPINSGSLTLHGGPLGFDKRQWSLVGEGESYVSLAYTAEDGEQGFPGRVRVEIKFSVTDDNEVKLEYCGQLDDGETKSTPINLTNHSYFNLNGANSAEASRIRDHMVSEQIMLSPLQGGNSP